MACITARTTISQMHKLAQAAIALLPGGLLALSAWAGLRCRHRSEMLDRVDGRAVLRCRRCLKARTNPLAVAAKDPRPETGIERDAREERGHIAEIERDYVRMWRPR